MTTSADILSLAERVEQRILDALHTSELRDDDIERIIAALSRPVTQDGGERERQDMGAAEAMMRDAHKILARAEAAERLNADLAGALEPFANEADEWNAHVPDDRRPEIVACDGSRGDARFTVGDLRKARATLSRYRGDGEA